MAARRRPARLLLALLLAATLTTCAGRERATRQPPPYQLSGASCLRALTGRNADLLVDSWTPPPAARACRVDTPLRATAGRTVRFVPALETSCAMLVAWADLEPDMQRAAARDLGQPVRAVRNYGSHGCRGMSGNRGTPSLHATARALDVSGFELADGTVLTVAEGWNGGTRAERRFLRAVRDAACRRMGVILSPDRDSYHRDHLHLDLGGWRLCG